MKYYYAISTAISSGGSIMNEVTVDIVKKKEKQLDRNVQEILNLTIENDKLRADNKDGGNDNTIRQNIDLMNYLHGENRTIKQQLAKTR
jgi:hypothetical protein